MTRLSYLVPCLAGILRLNVLQSTSITTESIDLLLLAFLLSAFSFGLCLLHTLINFFASRVCWNEKASLSLQLFNKSNGCAFVASILCNSEIYISLWCAMKLSRYAWIPMLSAYSQGQLITALVADLNGFFWASMQKTSSKSISGFLFILFGTLIIQFVSNCYQQIPTYIVLSLLAGSLNIISMLASRKLSLTFWTYRSGTFINCLEQFVVFSIATLIWKGSLTFQTVSVSKSLFHIFLGALNLIFSLSCTQFFADRGGIFPVTAPIVGGQIFMAGMWNFNLLTGFLSVSIFCVVLGSILTWNGRVDSHKLTHEAKFNPSIY